LSTTPAVSSDRPQGPHRADGRRGSCRGARRTVTVNDNYYGPSSKLTIHVGDTVKWHWTDEATDVHDVALKSGPKGAPKFASDAMAAGDDFKRKLTKAGTYKIICTFHEEVMKMTITVKKLPTTK
jgi:plastocyanin